MNATLRIGVVLVGALASIQFLISFEILLPVAGRTVLIRYVLNR
jgi:hypothetical protein